MRISSKTMPWRTSMMFPQASLYCRLTSAWRSFWFYANTTKTYGQPSTKINWSMVYHHYSIKYQVFWYSTWLTQLIDGPHTLSWRVTSQLLIITWQLWNTSWCWWLKNVDISLLTMIFLKMIFSKMWNSTKNLLKSSSLSTTPIMIRL